MHLFPDLTVSTRTLGMGGGLGVEDERREGIVERVKSGFLSSCEGE